MTATSMTSGRAYLARITFSRRLTPRVQARFPRAPSVPAPARLPSASKAASAPAAASCLPALAQEVRNGRLGDARELLAEFGRSGGGSLREELGQYYIKDAVPADDSADGSIMIIVATDAPLGDRNLERLAKRAIAGLARTGATMTDGSGDYVIAFSTADDVRRTAGATTREFGELANSAMSPLFQAVAEATEEAIYNSLLQADDTVGHRGKVTALPADRVKRLIDRQ